MRPGAVILGLTAEPETLVERVLGQARKEGTGAARPLLAGDPVARMRSLQDVRGELYRRADITIITENMSPAAVAQRAEQAVRDRATAGAVPDLSIGTPIERSDLYIKRGVRSLVGILARERWPRSRRCWIVTDDNVAQYWLTETASALREADFDLREFVVPAGEESKSLAQLSHLLDGMTTSGVSRSDVVVALGGGMVGDLAGLAAAVCLRGLSLVQMPTSLLAMVDSSVGGKTGINTDGGKNMVGAFYQPGLVLIDPDFLGTLPDAEYRSGMAEVIKHAWIQPSTPLASGQLMEQLNRLASLDPIADDAAVEIVRSNVRTKHSVVQADERESGLRMILNFGHTAGHAIEADGYRYRHGEAVALGMLAAAHIAASMDLIGGDSVQALAEMIERAGLPTRLNGSIGTVLDNMRSDKKNVAGVQRWILPSTNGGVVIRDDVERQAVVNALAAIGGS
jgi:3-dehydroquinate synthase